MKGLNTVLVYSNLKKIIITTILFMIVGTVLELYLIGHYESVYQCIPIVCITLGLLNITLLFFKKTSLTKQSFLVILMLSALSGIYGVFLHLRGNYWFEKEITPTANDYQLVLESLSGAFPILAPLSMVIFALIGYSYLILINQKQ